MHFTGGQIRFASWGSTPAARGSEGEKEGTRPRETFSGERSLILHNGGYLHPPLPPRDQPMPPLPPRYRRQPGTNGQVLSQRSNQAQTYESGGVPEYDGGGDYHPGSSEPPSAFEEPKYGAWAYQRAR
jgi:hypothetical protein